jgi:hydroxyacylglutathione hydrolase
MFQTNCYVLAADGASECVVVDPGQDAAPKLAALLAERGLTPAAVLLTHGHFDHVWNLREVCEQYSAPAYIHGADRHMIADPASGAGPAISQLVRGLTFAEPDELIEISDGDVIEAAGLSLAVIATPGHTRGSVVFLVDGVALTGDTLFRRGVGRTDLPGGDGEQLITSIKTRLLPLPDETPVLPGHGGASTIGEERRENPFL